MSIYTTCMVIIFAMLVGQTSFYAMDFPRPTPEEMEEIKKDKEESHKERLRTCALLSYTT